LALPRFNRGMNRIAAAVTLVAVALGTTAGTATAEPPHLTVPHVARAPQLDDFAAMDADDAPNGMVKVQGFVQRFPNDGEAVSERTVVYVGYDDEFLHVVFLCFDREPSRIGAHFVGRDQVHEDVVSAAALRKREGLVPNARRNEWMK
jgi:hypothetical protein